MSRELVIIGDHQQLLSRLEEMGLCVTSDENELIVEDQSFFHDNISALLTLREGELDVDIQSQPPFLSDEAVDQLLEDIFKGTQQKVELDESELKQKQIDSLTDQVKQLQDENKRLSDEHLAKSHEVTAVSEDRALKATELVQVRQQLESTALELREALNETSAVTAERDGFKKQVEELQNLSIDQQQNIESLRLEAFSHEEKVEKMKKAKKGTEGAEQNKDSDGSDQPEQE